MVRRLRFGIETLLGLKSRGFFIPYRYADRLPAPGTRTSYAWIEELFASCTPAFGEVLAAMAAVAGDLDAIGRTPPPAPRWTQDWFPRLDGAALYALIRRHRPRRIVEVGSGHSTRFAARAVRDGGLDTSLTAVDPAPRADLAALPVDLRRVPVQDVDLSPFVSLEPGDMLIIDSSHILMPGTDVDFLVSRILPGLPAGVFVHFHDILLPDDYPAAWAWRGYNEQQAVAALMAGGGFEPVFASHYVATRMTSALDRSVAATLPLLPGAHETSLWLRKTAVPRIPLTQV